MESAGAVMQPIHAIHDWADPICDLPRKHLLSRRVVLVPNERVAHALRRELIASGRHDVLVGAWFATTAALCAEVLACEATPPHTGKELLRRTRLTALFDSAPVL